MPETPIIPPNPVPANSTIKVTVRPGIEPDLVNFKVSNPVTYLRLWWKKVMSKEGIDFRFRIHPVMVMFIASAFAVGGFGVGRISVFSYIPILNKIISPNTPNLSNSPTPQAISDWSDSALTGKLQITPNSNKYYLLTSSYMAISLQFSKEIDLTRYLGKRILATGSYNQKTHTLIISDILDLEVLPPSPVPVVVPSQTATASPTATP